MALGDIKVLRAAQFGELGSRLYQVHYGTAASIKAGEPVLHVLGTRYVSALATNSPSVGTNYMAGIAATSSTDTTTVDGTVRVQNLIPGVVYMCKANDTTLINTQAKYNALVGKRVFFDLTAGVYTVLLTDSQFGGLVVEDMDITDNPNMVAFTIREGVSYMA